MATTVIKVDRDNGTADAGASAAGGSVLGSRIAPAVRAMRAGKLVAFPTETVYGVGVLATSARAVGRLRKLKDRPTAPFTVHLASPAEAAGYLDDPPVRARTLMAKAWPGPMTLLLPAARRLAHPSLRGRAAYRRICHDGVVGLRCPADAVARALLERAGRPVLATSANLAGRKPPTSAEEVLEQLGGLVDVLIDAGKTRYRKASTIVAFDGERYRLLRAGVYDDGDVRRLARRRILFVCTGNTCRSPMASALARKVLAERMACEVEDLAELGQELMSAGISAPGGGPVSSGAFAAAEKLGAPIEKRQSRKLTNELINSADLIFCMTRRHVAEVTGRVGAAAGKTYLLDPDGDIADPIGGDAETYERAARRIERNLRKRMKENLP